jgi:hypothetical protein
MTGGGHPSAAGRGRARWRAERAALGRQELLGCGAGDGLRQELGQKEKEEGGGKKRLSIFKTIQTNEFKQEFEFKHSKQCTSMYATVNSYISLFN